MDQAYKGAHGKSDKFASLQDGLNKFGQVGQRT